MTFQTATPQDMVPEAASWVGRTERRDGRLSSDLAGMLCAATGHPGAAVPDLLAGAPMPPLWHWAAFPEFVPQQELGTDGHPRLGGFLPALPQPRRMWAGGALEFEGTLRIGEALRKRSEILAVEEKTGTTGPMVFVKVAHEIAGAAGRIRERQDIVYLHIPKSFRPPKPVPAPESEDFREMVEINEARLFRFSAATFNAHRIHYDLVYSRDVERYPALVVHGPLQAMLLMEAAVRYSGRQPASFTFRGVHPMFHDQDLALVGRRCPSAPRIELCTVAPAGHQGLQARMEWA